MGAHRVATVSPSAVTATTAPSNMVTATSSVTVSDSTSRSRFASSQVLVTVADRSATQSARATAAQSPATEYLSTPQSPVRSCPLGRSRDNGRDMHGLKIAVTNRGESASTPHTGRTVRQFRR